MKCSPQLVKTAHRGNDKAVMQTETANEGLFLQNRIHPHSSIWTKMIGTPSGRAMDKKLGGSGGVLVSHWDHRMALIQDHVMGGWWTVKYSAITSDSSSW